MITDHEETYMRLSSNERGRLQELSLEYYNTVKELLYQLSKITGKDGGAFRWSTPLGYIDIHVNCY